MTSPLKFCLLLLFSAALRGNAQKTQYSLRPVALNDGNNYTSMFLAADGLHAWISGSTGKMLLTSNGGKSWQDALRTGTTSALAMVCFFKDNLRGFAVGNGGTVITTSDGGKVWRPVSVPSTADLRSISFSTDESNGVIAGAAGTVLLSSDQGKTWTKSESVDSYGYWQAGFFPGSKRVFVCGTSTSFLTSNEEHTVWKDHISEEQNEQNDSSDLYCVYMDKGGQKVFAGADVGRLFVSGDGGNHWTITKLPTRAKLMQVWFDELSIHGWVVANNGEVYQSTDGGNTWRLNYSIDDPDAALEWVQFSKDNLTGWVLGDRNVLAHTIDGGKTWAYQKRPLFDIWDVYLSKDNTLGFLSGGHGNLVKSVDHFVHCTRISPAGFKTFINEFVYDSARQQIWMVADSNNIIARCNADGGDWQILYSEEKAGYVQSLVVNQDDNYICAVTGNSTALLSDLAGKKWEKVRVDTVNFRPQCLFYERRRQMLFTVGRWGMAYQSTDQGRHWKKINFPDSTQWLTNIVFNSTGLSGYLVSSSDAADRHLYSTDDGGITWKKVLEFPINSGLQGISFGNNENNIMVTGVGGGLYRSADGGATWFEVVPKYTYRRLTRVHFDEKDNPTIVGYGGAILRPGKVDLFPEIRDLKIKDTGDGYKPSFTVSDDGSQEGLPLVKISVAGPLIVGADVSYKKWAGAYSEVAGLPEMPASILNPNQRYTYRITVFDGWNIVSRDTSFFFGKPLWGRIRSFMHWDQLPSDAKGLQEMITVNGGLLAVLYILVVLGLFIFLPAHFVAWHEAVANSKLPFPEKLSKFLVLFLISHERSLNAFVKTHLSNAVILFFKNKDVSSRQYWVPAPFQLDYVNHVTFGPTNPAYCPGLTEIQSHLNGSRVIVSIEGPGGVGKSSLAFQLAKWVYHEKPAAKLWEYPALPVFINNINDDLDKMVINQLKYLTDSSVISESLGKALLKKKKVLVIVDGISEMQLLKPEFIDPQKGAFDVHAVVYTSRKPTGISEAVTIIPLGLRLGYLDSLIDGFTNVYVGANRFEDQREILRSRIKVMIGAFSSLDPEKQIPLGMLRLIIERASLIMDRGGSLQVELPNSYYSLIEEYLSDLLRKVDAPDDRIVLMRAAAMVSMGLIEFIIRDKKPTFESRPWEQFRPQWMLSDYYQLYIPPADLQLFLSGGVLIESGWLGEKQLKFQNDPIAEYLVASEICISYQTGHMNEPAIKELLRLCRKTNEAFYRLIIEVSQFKKIVLPDDNIKL